MSLGPNGTCFSGARSQKLDAYSAVFRTGRVLVIHAWTISQKDSSPSCTLQLDMLKGAPRRLPSDMEVGKGISVPLAIPFSLRQLGLSLRYALDAPSRPTIPPINS